MFKGEYYVIISCSYSEFFSLNTCLTSEEMDLVC